MSAKREHEESQREGRMIPIHIRFVPKDIWIRLHIDSKSTIGSVKDAVLDKLKMPPFDPTVLPGFYEEARYAMVKPALHPMEARAFPKAFVARCPKRNVAEVVESESRKIIGKELWDPIKSSPSKFNARLKGKGSLALARELIGGDAGDGGMGSMSYVGNITSTNSPSKTNDIIGGDTSKRGEAVSLVSSATSSPTTSKLLKSVRGAKNPRLKASMLSLSTVAKEAQRDLLDSPSEAAGLDGYVDHLPITLLGNTDAKRKEEEAMMQLGKIDSNSSSSLGPDKVLDATPQRTRLTTHSSPSVSSSIHEVSLTSQPEQTDLELDDSSSDEESLHSHGRGTTKSLLSSGSDSSSLSIMQKPHLIASRFRNKGHVKVASLLGATGSTSDVNSIALSSAATERGRSGTLLAGPDSQSGRSSAQMMRIGSDISANSASHPLSLRAATSSTSSLNQLKEQYSQGNEGGRTNAKAGLGEGMSNSGIGGSRIAGIQLDEISSWRDAQHALSKFYCVYSYSNGHMLEDWRTVAAFRIRPYELLEIQYSSPQERVHLPKGGGLDHITNNNSQPHRRSTVSLSELEGSDHYSAPCCEGWCYIFKRNSGNQKAQRANLGVWKLRYIVIRGSRLAVHRRKPARSSVNDLQNTLAWNINTIECVFSERADGWTRPALMPMQGLSSDIVTLLFPADASPPAYVNNETMGWVQSSYVSLSMRFISQLDTWAFFNTFARATTVRLQGGDRRPSRPGVGGNEYRKKVVTRATIAGRGGAVLPGRAGREGGRNAMARSRLRPSGVSREFDDVDRWSSHSEEEGNDKVTTTKDFKYSDLLSSASGSNRNLKDAFFDPSYKVGQLSPGAIIQAQDSMSPRGAMANLVPEGQPNGETISASSSTKGGRSPVVTESSSRPTRARGFSFAKAARKALAPSDSSFQSSQQRKSPTTPVSPASTAEEERKPAAANHDGKKRRSTQPELVSAAKSNTQADDSTDYKDFSSNYFEQRATPSRLSSLGNINRLSQQTPSPSANLAGRHRSFTLASSTTPPSSNRRSMGLRTPSSSSSGHITSNFHWPFRGAHSRGPPSVDSKAESANDVASVDLGANHTHL